MRAAIVGARGYLGRELLRLLLEHPKVDEVVPSSGRAGGKPIEDVLPGLAGAKAPFVDAEDPRLRDCDVLFTATPGGVAAEHIARAEVAGCRLVIDLSRDHRHKGLRQEDDWVYGAADLWPVEKGVRRIANPGCYPTASSLAAAPAVAAGATAGGVMVFDGKSGVSGAGVVARDDLHYAEMNETMRAYKVKGHDHEAEIQGVVGRLGGTARVRFTPHLVPLTRGLLATAYLPLERTDDLRKAYEKHYVNAPFVDVVEEADARYVRATNRAVVAVDVDEEAQMAIVRCAIDNILKGGSGTAIQNMNNAFGWPSDLGLPRLAPSP